MGKRIDESSRCLGNGRVAIRLEGSTSGYSYASSLKPISDMLERVE